MDLSRRALFRGRFSSNSIAIVQKVRMPWMVSSEVFTDHCSRCAKCIDVCPEQIIEKGDGGYPTVNFKHGECTFCAECVDVCSEPVFRNKEEKPWDLVANITEAFSSSSSVSLDGVCMAHQGVVCQSCKDVCDVRAIRMSYQSSTVPVPVIDDDVCTGCGACLSVCPTQAIQMSSIEKKNLMNNCAADQQTGVKE
ncbi:ferredoxin-type protein NapF [Litoribrevibacter albus]|uniref:Ferredoxin-type protein NapF n=1 Tax=Litoribrevibacter albus TaxID=1473156 RepID=A0AA37S880_9GAMM|nr:ferredoxin-type protein NapF [Litoribrevibacter albus]GLQ29823.1 ferredoxin-type protein NapF [Litoribrevibacter albus]